MKRPSPLSVKLTGQNGINLRRDEVPFAGHTSGPSAVSVKSTDSLGGAPGRLEDGASLAGQLRVLPGGTIAAQNSALGLAKLGVISLSDSLIDPEPVAGGSTGGFWEAV